MTPRTFFREVKAAELRAEDRLRDLTFGSWQTVRVYFESQSKKRLVSIKKLFEEIGTSKKEPQTEGQMKAALHMIAAMNKLPIRIEKK